MVNVLSGRMKFPLSAHFPGAGRACDLSSNLNDQVLYTHYDRQTHAGRLRQSKASWLPGDRSPDRGRCFAPSIIPPGEGSGKFPGGEMGSAPNPGAPPRVECNEHPRVVPISLRQSARRRLSDTGAPAGASEVDASAPIAIGAECGRLDIRPMCDPCGEFAERPAAMGPGAPVRTWK